MCVEQILPFPDLIPIPTLVSLILFIISLVLALNIYTHNFTDYIEFRNCK